MSTPELMQAFDFSAEELRVNRSGQLSPRQKAQLQKDDLQQTLDLGCALGVFAVGIGLVLAACSLLFNISALLQSFSIIAPFVLGGIVLLVIAALVVNWQGARERRQAGLGPVRVYEGPIQLREEEGGFNARYYLGINDDSFRIDAAGYDALIGFAPGTAFRVYVAFQFGRVLSIEAETDALPAE